MTTPCHQRRFAPALLLLTLGLAAAGCSGGVDEEVAVGIIAPADAVYSSGLSIDPAGRAYRAAIAQGLVGFDDRAQAIPALAESWIVTDDGRSYIFRLRTGEWQDGETISATAVTAALQRRIMALSGTALGRDLAIINDVRAMAGRVIEIRLKAPMPQFLALMAQPELAIADGADPRGAMIASRIGDATLLQATPPDQLGMPIPRRWEETVRPVRITPLSAAEAVDRFGDNDFDVVLGGTIADYPLAPSGTLTRGNVRVEATQGLFGLRVMRARGLLATPQGREAISLAIDRGALMAQFNLSGWNARSAIVPADLTRLDADAVFGASAQDIAQRRDLARQQVARWRAANRLTRPSISVQLPAGPGSDRLLRALTADLSAIGVSLWRAEPGDPADLMLVDEVARYPAARWYLNQLACVEDGPLCSGFSDSLIDEALEAPTMAEREQLLAEAEADLAAFSSFISFGDPIRWMLIRSSVTGITANALGYHPLPPLSAIPN